MFKTLLNCEIVGVYKQNGVRLKINFQWKIVRTHCLKYFMLYHVLGWNVRLPNPRFVRRQWLLSAVLDFL